MSTAALAAGDPLPGSRPLVIGMPQETPASGWPGALTSAPKATTGAGAVLSRPEPIVQPVPRDDSAPVPAVATAPTAAPPGGAPDPFDAQLKARGVTMRRADNVAGGVKFSCLVPNPQNPNVSRVYEAIGPDYASAVRAVLWKIDQQK
jgi:hypothetical protein